MEEDNEKSSSLSTMTLENYGLEAYKYVYSFPPIIRQQQPQSLQNISNHSSSNNSNGNKPPFYRIKILSIGNANVGKSCLIKRFCEQKFVSSYIATIGVDYGVKQIQRNGDILKVNFWDLSGDKVFYDIRKEFYANSQVVILLFDVSNRKSFESLQSWLNEANENGLKNPMLYILCGCKSDLRASSNNGNNGSNGNTNNSNNVRNNNGANTTSNSNSSSNTANSNNVSNSNVSASEINEWAEKHRHMKYFETSSLTGENVQEMFTFIFDTIIQRMQSKQSSSTQ